MEKGVTVLRIGHMFDTNLCHHKHKYIEMNRFSLTRICKRRPFTLVLLFVDQPTILSQGLNGAANSSIISHGKSMDRCDAWLGRQRSQSYDKAPASLVHQSTRS